IAPAAYEKSCAPNGWFTAVAGLASNAVTTQRARRPARLAACDVMGGTMKHACPGTAISPPQRADPPSREDRQRIVPVAQVTRAGGHHHDPALRCDRLLRAC